MNNLLPSSQYLSSCPMYGMVQKEVAKQLMIGERTIRSWWKRHKNGNSLEDKPRSGRPTVINRTGKIIIAKSVGKRNQSTRKLSRKLKAKGHKVPRETVRRYLKNELHLKLYKMRPKPKLRAKQREHRLKFSQERRN